jgi:threonine/homoserine/homoserine lactone efflux protein
LLEPVILLIAVAAITPGPNNLIVMEAAGRRGVWAAGRAIAGVVTGSLVLLVLVAAGFGVIMAAPQARLAITVASGAYLAWLALSLLRTPRADAPQPRSAAALPTSTAGVAAFQLTNPKAWALVATAAAALGAGRWPLLALLIAVTSAVCLTLWAVMGAALSRVLERLAARLWFHRSMGGLMALSALGVIFHAVA